MIHSDGFCFYVVCANSVSLQDLSHWTEHSVLGGGEFHSEPRTGTCLLLHPLCGYSVTFAHSLCRHSVSTTHSRHQSLLTG